MSVYNMNFHVKRLQKIVGILVMILLCSAVLFLGVIPVYAEQPAADAVYTNPDTGYQVVVSDDAGLFLETERYDLAEQMQKITEYGNVALITIDENSSSAQSYAASCYRELFGTDSGTLFLIDMDNRMLWIHSDGAVYETITKDYADTITDNVYTYASYEDYYQCAMEVFGQIDSLLDGQRIAQPMKYISNLFLALILALLINFGVVKYFTGLKKFGNAQMLDSIQKSFEATPISVQYTHETKIYSPVSSDSGGGSSSSGGSGGGGGGHSGGGSSGGGGGHRF